MTNFEYHNRSEISKSDIDLMLKSMSHFKNKVYEEPTPNMVLGSAFHKLVLEYDDFESEFAVLPNVDKRTKAGKEAYDKFLASIGSKTAIDIATFEKAKAMADNIKSDPAISNFLSNGVAEESHFSEIDGVKVKARPDFYNKKLGLIVDLKTTSSAKPSEFAKSVANFNYHIQVAFYSDVLRSLGYEVNGFLFIGVESKEPFYTGLFELDDEAVELGRSTYKAILQRYKHCLESGFFPGYASFDENDEISPVVKLSLPNWKYYEVV